MTKYKHIFFDLDHTLWDFDTNSSNALSELFIHFNLKARSGYSAKEFIEKYRKVNDQLWEVYRNGKISKPELRKARFVKALEEIGVVDQILASRFDELYMNLSPKKTALMEGTLETLEELSRYFCLHVLTNGFYETQLTKLNCSGIKSFFKEIIASDVIGSHKPQATIFMEALRITGASRKNTLMVGDNLFIDVQGARNVGIDQVYFNPSKTSHQEKSTYEIESLKELIPLLLG